jgi:hypothetical protein
MNIYAYFLISLMIFLTGYEIAEDGTAKTFGTLLIFLPIFGRVLGLW